MKKFFKRLLIVLLLVIIFTAGVSIRFANSIKYEVTNTDLPTNVYESNGDLLTYAKLKIVGLVLATNDQRYSMLEEIVNLIILDSIQKNINSSYDPLGDCSDIECQYIYKESPVYLNYTYAYINDDNQMVIVISGGSDKYVELNTALFLVFNIDINIVGLEVKFTLDNYSLGERDLSMNLLNMIFDKLDKDNIENSITFGELDLDKYEYTISISDAF